MDPNKYPSANPHETAQKPNYFEGMSSIEEVLPEYQRLIGEAADEHQHNFAQAPEPPRVAGLLTETSIRVEGILGAVGNTLEPMLDRESRWLLSDIRKGAYIYGMSSDLVKPKVDTAPPAVRAILDAEVLSSTRNVKLEYQEDVLATASSPSARGAIKAALDLQRLERARKMVQEGVGSIYMKTELEAASTPDVAEALGRTMKAEQRQHTSQQDSLFNFELPGYGDLTPEDLLGGMFDTGVFGDILNGRAAKGPKPSSGGDKNKPPEQPKEPIQERVSRTDEVTQIIDNAITVNQQYGWLKDTPDAVKAALDTVRERRRGGESDDKIYREIRLAAERGDVDATESVKVLDALKDGPQGTLPF